MSSVPPPAYPHPGPPPPLPERPAGAPPPGRRAPGQPPWAPWTGLVAPLAILAAVTVLGLFAFPFAGDDEELPDGLAIGLTFMQDILFVGGAILFAWIARRPSAVDFGLVKPHVWKAVGLLIATWLAFFVFSGIWIALLGIEEKDQLLDDLGAKESAVKAAVLAVLVAVGAPVAEEVLFRGYMFGALRNWKGVWPAAVVVGLVFGGIHAGGSPVGFLVPLAVLGFLLCLLYAWTGSLYPCIVVHALNNGLAFGVALDWTWQVPLVMAGAVAGSVLVARALAGWLGPASAVPPPPPPGPPAAAPAVGFTK